MMQIWEHVMLSIFMLVILDERNVANHYEIVILAHLMNVLWGVVIVQCKQMKPTQSQRQQTPMLSPRNKWASTYSTDCRTKSPPFAQIVEQVFLEILIFRPDRNTVRRLNELSLKVGAKNVNKNFYYG